MAKYKGPCIDCGEYKNQNYIRQRCPACNERFRRRNPEFVARKKYDGPCINCGGTESTNGRFVRKMCSKCYSRFKETGSPSLKERRKYLGPCIVCGSPDPGYQKYFQEKMCGKCYRHYIYRQVKPELEKFCIDCGKPIGPTSVNKRCRRCHRRWMRHTSPEYKANEYARNKKYSKTDKGIITSRDHVRRRRAKLAQVENTLTRDEWQEILSQYKHRCAYCGSTKQIEMDHIIPLSKGGPHTKNNVIPACRRCNGGKSNRLPPKPVQPVLL